MTIEDPLKPLDQLDQPDERSAAFVGTLADRHEELAAIVLHDGVPEDVAQLFETAKNVSLYSWFVYRFHQVAESVALQALEAGLRIRCIADPAYRGRPGLRGYLRHAQSSGWLRDDRFSGRRQRAVARARMKAIIKQIPATQIDVPIPVEPPTEEDIERELAEMSFVQNLVRAVPAHRNELAHGSSMLMPSSATTLRAGADILNQIFEDEADPEP